jgi:hypothetical protein
MFVNECEKVLFKFKRVYCAMVFGDGVWSILVPWVQVIIKKAHIDLQLWVFGYGSNYGPISKNNYPTRTLWCLAMG